MACDQEMSGTLADLDAGRLRCQDRMCGAVLRRDASTHVERWGLSGPEPGQDDELLVVRIETTCQNDEGGIHACGARICITPPPRPN